MGGRQPRHSFSEDAQGIAFGSFMAAVSVVLLTHLGFVTGQTAGLAILICYGTGWAFGPVFFVINLPFYWLGWKRFGPTFVAKSFLAVAILSALSMVLPEYLHFGETHPAVGAVLVGCLTGVGLIALFRHGSSLGGIGIVGLYVQDATGFRAGWVQLIFDAVAHSSARFRGSPPLAVRSSLTHLRCRFADGPRLPEISARPRGASFTI